LIFIIETEHLQRGTTYNFKIPLRLIMIFKGLIILHSTLLQAELLTSSNKHQIKRKII